MFLFSRNTNQIIEITKNTSFGRDSGDMTFSDDDSMSGRHGEFIFENAELFILDLQSTNGTFINKNKIESHEKILLENFDEVLVGEQEFVVLFKFYKNLDEMEKDIKHEKAKRLLSKSKDAKKNKILKLEEEIKNIKHLYDEKRNVLVQIKKEYDDYETKISDNNQKVLAYQKEINELTQNKSTMLETLESKKIPLYSKQTDLMDKLQLLKTTGTNENDQELIQLDLDKISEDINSIDEEKNDLSKKADILHQKIKIIEQENDLLKTKRTETKKQFDSKSKEISPLLSKFKKDIENKIKELNQAKLK